jgi:hypothetical protein
VQSFVSYSNVEACMAANGSNQKNKFIVFILATAVVALALYLLLHFELELRAYLGARLTSHAVQDSLVRIPQFILWSVLAFLGVRALNSVTFDFLDGRVHNSFRPDLPTHLQRS